MEVKRDHLACAVCVCHEEGGVVIPTNTRLSVFTMRHIDNWDSKSQRNFSQSEYHGRILGVPNHLSLDKLGVKHTPIEINVS